MTVALLTPTYRHDLEQCTLLCESVDRHVTSFSTHYLLVPDADVDLFTPLANARRVVLPASWFLPTWLHPLPRLVRRKRRQFWWSLRARPVSGWHIQQILKIAACIELPNERYCILDSDIVFFRDIDLARFNAPNPAPLLTLRNEVTENQPAHVRWVETSHRLLDFPMPPLPADDFIGHIIFWDQETVRAMANRIEDTSGMSWAEALCRVREFSEYMLYGIFVQREQSFSAAHVPVSDTPCVSYWDEPTLGERELQELLSGAGQDDVAFSIASFSGTPVTAIRAALKEHERTYWRARTTNVLKELASLC
ncbi:MAG TPA: DUF6492 family protein [Bradyrhizobium sp.]